MSSAQGAAKSPYTNEEAPDVGDQGAGAGGAEGGDVPFPPRTAPRDDRGGDPQPQAIAHPGGDPTAELPLLELRSTGPVARPGERQGCAAEARLADPGAAWARYASKASWKSAVLIPKAASNASSQLADAGSRR